MGFRENLKSELSYQNILVKELAALTGISKNTIDNYVNVRKYMPSADAAVKIAKALGVTVEYLVTGEEGNYNKSLQNQEIKDLIKNFKLLRKDDRKLIIAIIDLMQTRI